MVNGILNNINIRGGATAIALATAFVTRVEEDGGVVESQSCLTDRIDNLKRLGLWNKASAVWLPHGYKEGKLYAAKGGSAADLTITRAGTRTRKGPTYVEQVPYNLLGYSNSLNNAYWGKTNITVTENDTLSPSGNVNANKITETTVTAAHTIGRSLTGGPGTYTIEFFAKAGTRKYLGFQFYNLTYTGEINFGFDIEAGTMLTPATAGTGVSGSSAISQAENGFFKITLTINVTNTATTGFVSTWYLRNASGTGALSYLGDTGSYLYLYGINIVSGSALDYFQTTDRFNVPALDYTNDTCPALSLEPARTNLCQQSETFDNATWVKTGVTVTANTTLAPDGLSTADTLIEGVGAGDKYIGGNSIAITTGTTYTISCYGKAVSTNRYFLIFGFGLGGANEVPVFDLVNGTVDIPATTTIFKSASIESVLDVNGDATGWYRCIVTFTSNITGTAFLDVGMSDNATDNTSSAYNYTGDGTSSVHIWGAQVEAGSYATSYIPTTTGSVMRIADAVSALYPEKTNLVLHSEDWSNAVWLKDSVTITTDATTAPNGSTTADKLTETATGPSPHRTYQQIATTAGKVYVYSVYVKAAGKTVIFLQETADSGIAVFDLSSGTISGVAASRASISDKGNGWYRCSLYWTAGDATAVCQIGLGNGATYTGDGSSGVYVWGAQFEGGDTVTTYLPTTTTPVHDGSVIGQTEGTLYFEGSSFADTTNKQISLCDGTQNERVVLAFNSNNIVAYISRGVGNTTITTPFTTGTRYKIAITYKDGYAALFVNGAKIGESLTAVIPSTNQIKFTDGGTAAPFFGEIAGLSLTTTWQTDAYAIALTTP